MPLPVQRRRSLDFSSLTPDQFNGKNNECKDKQQEADTVNAMHVFDPLRFWPGRIRFPEVKVFCDLFDYTHKKTVS